MEKTTRDRLEAVLIEWLEDKQYQIDDETIPTFPEVARVLLDLLNAKENADVNGAYRVDEKEKELILSEFESIHLDLANDLFLINGVDVKHSMISIFELTFNNGSYELKTDNRF